MALSKLVDPSFPAELILEVVERLPFSFGKSNDILTLEKTHPRLRFLIRSYEASLTKIFAAKELRHASVDFPVKKQGFNWLLDCNKKYDVVDDLMAMLVSKENVLPIPKHNMSLVNTGLLLLYHLQSFESHNDKLAFLKSSPKDPLMAMYLAVHHATLTARYHGEGLIHQRTYGRFMDGIAFSIRTDVEFCFNEASMEMGPAFIHSSLLPTASASSDSECTLLNFYHDHADHDWDPDMMEGAFGGIDPPITHGPHKEYRERSLWTTLLERMAKLMEDCKLSNVRGAIEEDAASTSHHLAWLDMWGKETLMKGEDLIPDLVPSDE